MPTILRLFWYDGYSGSTLDRVAAELGVTKPTLCRTLGEKEAIFVAALEEYHRTFIAPAEVRLEQARTLRGALGGAFDVFAERVLSEGLPAGCFLGDSAMVGGFETGPIADTISRLQGRLVSLVQRRVKAAIDDGELDPNASAEAVVPFILSQVFALSAISRSRPTRAQLDAMVGFMLDGLPWGNAGGTAPAGQSARWAFGSSSVG